MYNWQECPAPWSIPQYFSSHIYFHTAATATATTLAEVRTPTKAPTSPPLHPKSSTSLPPTNIERHVTPTVLNSHWIYWQPGPHCIWPWSRHSELSSSGTRHWPRPSIAYSSSNLPILGPQFYYLSATINFKHTNLLVDFNSYSSFDSVTQTTSSWERQECVAGVPQFLCASSENGIFQIHSISTFFYLAS